MPLIDVIDETFVVAPAAQVAAALKDPARHREWWPGLRLSVYDDRGDKGVRWTLSGDLVGSSEFWLEPFRDGIVVHYYLRADPTVKGSSTKPVTGDPARLWRPAMKTADRHRRRLKVDLNRLKDELEGGRAAGEPALGSP